MAGAVTKAFVLAAGFGLRARPLSLVRPKPLFPVLGRPLISHTLENLGRAGVGEVVVNAHHLAGRLVDYLTGAHHGPVIEILREDPILGTGGGIRNATPFLGAAPFFVVNGDIFTDLDLTAAAAEHFENGPLATLALHDHPRFNQVAVDEAGYIAGFRGRLRPGADPRSMRYMAFTGVHVVSPELIGSIPEGPGDIIPVYQALIEAGARVRAFFVEGAGWWEAGTFESYLNLHAGLLSRREEGPVYMSEWAELGDGSRINGFAALGEGVVVEPGAVVEDSVLWPGARVAAGVKIKGCVLADGATARKDAVGRPLVAGP
ncbi:MAG: sugar phosphate nucleotidyltransferase [Thermodesulfobacteriota bacterium]